MRSQVYYLSLASCLSGRSSKEGPCVLGMAFCLSHTSILQDDASGVFDTPELRSKTARWPRPSVLLAFVETPRPASPRRPPPLLPVPPAAFAGAKQARRILLLLPSSCPPGLVPLVGEGW